MNNSTTYRQYSHNDIREYLNGNMTSREMYALEMQALEDPFLADAIEGYNTIETSTATTDLQYLNQQLYNKHNQAKLLAMPKRKPIYTLLKIAAAACIISMVAYFGISNYNKKNTANNPIANNTTTNNNTTNNSQFETDTTNLNKEVSSLKTVKPTITAQSAIKPTTVFVKPENIENYYKSNGNNYYAVTPPPVVMDDKREDKLTAKIEQIGETKLGNKDTLMLNNTAATAPTNYNWNTDKVADKDVARQPTPEVKYNTNTAANNNQTNSGQEVVVNGYSTRGVNATRKSNTEQLENVAKKELVKPNATQALPNYYFNYRITDNQGRAIPFTNISLPQEQLTTYSRVDGRFGLFSVDSVLNINVKAAGYLPITTALRTNKDYLNIVLTPIQANNDDATVLGDAKIFKAKQRSAKPTVEIIEVEPLDGIANYDSYIANNINIKEKPQGEVILTFDIDKNGDPTNIAVAQSLSSAADEEAVRVLTAGPKWKKKTKKKNKGKIVIRF